MSVLKNFIANLVRGQPVCGKNRNIFFQKRGGGGAGGQRPFGNFPKIHPFGRDRLPLELSHQDENLDWQQNWTRCKGNKRKSSNTSKACNSTSKLMKFGLSIGDFGEISNQYHTQLELEIEMDLSYQKDFGVDKKNLRLSKELVPTLLCPRGKRGGQPQFKSFQYAVVPNTNQFEPQDKSLTSIMQDISMVIHLSHLLKAK